jgi:hypothetical protein
MLIQPTLKATATSYNASMDLTLFLHRVSLSSEVPPMNGFYVTRNVDRRPVNNDISIYIASNMTVGDDQNLVGVVGIQFFLTSDVDSTVVKVDVDYNTPN